MTYEEWMDEVDGWVWRLVGCSVWDLPDYEYMTSFENGRKPRTTARAAIRAAHISA